jgi:hypothetical protein
VVVALTIFQPVQVQTAKVTAAAHPIVLQLVVVAVVPVPLAVQVQARQGPLVEQDWPQVLRALRLPAQAVEAEAAQPRTALVVLVEAEPQPQAERTLAAAVGGSLLQVLDSMAAPAWSSFASVPHKQSDNERKNRGTCSTHRRRHRS